MATAIEEIGRVCRLCLRGEGLMVLLEATSSAFSIADAEHFTGVMFSKDDDVTSYAVCQECRLSINTSVCFRRSCLENDISFRKLVSLLKVRMKEKAAKNEVRTVHSSVMCFDDSEYSTDEIQFDQTMENDSVIVALYETDSDNSKHSLYGEAMLAILDESNPAFGIIVNEQPAGLVDDGRQNEDAACSKNSNLKTYDECETSELVSSLDEKVNCLLGGSKETEKEAAEGSVDSNQIFSYNSDSNDSLPSLYGEVMQKEFEKGRAKHFTKISAKPDDALNPIDKSRHVCPICGGLYVKINVHLLRSHGTEKRFACSHCQKKFQSMFLLKRHFNTWHEKRIILTCEQCGKGFVNASSHFSHVKNSHGKRALYQCEICPRKFKSIDGYTNHLKAHSITSYPCRHCDKLFKNAFTLEKHQLRYHPA